MTEIVTGYHFDIGGREVYEDRIDVQTFTTPGNLQLRVAAVADGVGGENKGERAAQLAIDALFRELRASTETDVPTALIKAVSAANEAVHGVVRETGGASTTITVAAVLNDEILYIANVGDSRVYLCRDQQLTQLTIDHTFANVMPWQGQLSPEEARANPRAEALMRAIGPRAQIPVDIGFYVNTTNPTVAHQRGLGGLPLRNGDSIMVCSDGVTKMSRKSGTPFVTDDEIVRVLTTQEGDRAARSLISFALGRDADDNVSAAVMQMPDPVRRSRARRPILIAGAAAVILIVAAVAAVWFMFQRQGREQASLAATATSEAIGAAETATRAAGAIATTVVEANELAQAATETAEAAATLTAVVAAFTPTPTATATPSSTPRPTRIANQIGIFLTGTESIAFTLADTIETGNSAGELHVNHNELLVAEDAYFFAQANTRIEFEAVTADPAAGAGIRLLLYEGSDIFVDTGGYDSGVDVSPIGDTRVSFLVSGSCMSLQYDADSSTISVGCYDGTCGYRAEERDDLTPFSVGEQVEYDVQERRAVETRPIRTSEGIYYRQILSRSSLGRQVYGACVLPLFPPTSTPTATPTATIRPTNTSVPAGGGGGSGSAPPPTPTNPAPPTMTPAPVSTAPPSPTATPCVGTSCQGLLAIRPTVAKLGVTAGWLGFGLLAGLALASDKRWRQRRQ